MRFKVAPQAVCRQLLTQLERYKSLTESEQAVVLSAIENCGIPTERVLADLQRNTIENLLGQLS